MDLKNYPSKGFLSVSSVISVNGLTPNDLLEVLSEALSIKQKEEVKEDFRELRGKNVCLITSRKIGASRLAFEIAASSLGATPITLTLGGSNIDSFLSTAESVKAIAKLPIAAFFVSTTMQKDAFVLNETLKALPVVNAFTSDGPVSALACLFTVYERIGRLSGIKACFIGNVKAHAELIEAFSKCEADVSVFTSSPDEELFEECRQFSEVTACKDALSAIRGANVVFTDLDGEAFSVTADELSAASHGAVYLHAAPVADCQGYPEEFTEATENAVAEVGANLMSVERAIISLICKKNG